MSVLTIAKIILVMLLWAACFPLITAGIEYAPHLTFAAGRALLAGLTLTALALVLRRPLPKGAGHWTMVAIVGFGATALGFLGMFHAAEFVSPGIATVIANTQPLLAAMLGSIVLKERLTKLGMTGLILGFVGILSIAAPELVSGGQKTYIVGIAYIMLAALGITVSNVVIKRIAGKIDALMAMGLQMLIGGVPLVLIAWATEDPASIRWSFTFVAVLIALSLFGTALVYWLWFSVLEKAPLNRANAFSFLIPIFGLTIGALFFDETLGWSQLGGIALAILGVSLVTRDGTKSAAVIDG
ncbi:DMT family transporter [Bauldia litoralis]|uniref:DMT family transporter n=1 Tax=Bauldia litoralis TaxID=665467 RepID=UPI00326765FF